jgi:hypothetical protein
MPSLWFSGSGWNRSVRPLPAVGDMSVAVFWDCLRIVLFGGVGRAESCEIGGTVEASVRSAPRASSGDTGLSSFWGLAVIYGVGTG